MNEVENDVRHQYALLVDPHTGQEFNLCRFATSVGRSISCDVVLTDKAVSRQHAVLYCLKGQFSVEDVGSTNGTMVNGRKLKERTALRAGDEIRIGITKLVFLVIPDRSASNVYIDQGPTVVKDEEVVSPAATPARSAR